MADSASRSSEQLLLEAEIQQLRAENARLILQQAQLLRQQAWETRYEHSQARFRTVFENSPLGHKIIAADLTIQQANPALVAMLDLAGPEELVGQGILRFAHPDHRADWQLLQERLWAHKMQNFTLETCLMRPDGSSFWCQVTTVLFQEDGHDVGYTTLEDISDRKEVELSLKRLYDAQETILHLVAHDLRNPVANIRMLAELLHRDITKPEAVVSANVPNYVDMIKQSCTQTTALLQDLLYLGQIDATRLKKEDTDLQAYLEDHLRVFRVAAQEKQIALTLELPPAKLQVRLHPEKFGRVLANLLANALKFTPAGGQIQVQAQEHEGHIRLLVRDNGIGIPEHLQAQVFDKFTAASRVGLYGDTHTGLGMFITKQIVELHHGRIWLESQEQEGTTFFIELQ